MIIRRICISVIIAYYQKIPTFLLRVQFNDRKDHFVAKNYIGEGYSIIFYKSYDMRYNYQPIFKGAKKNTQT